MERQKNSDENYRARTCITASSRFKLGLIAVVAIQDSQGLKVLSLSSMKKCWKRESLRFAGTSEKADIFIQDSGIRSRPAERGLWEAMSSKQQPSCGSPAKHFLIRLGLLLDIRLCQTLETQHGPGASICCQPPRLSKCCSERHGYCFTSVIYVYRFFMYYSRPCIKSTTQHLDLCSCFRKLGTYVFTWLKEGIYIVTIIFHSVSQSP